MHRSSTRPSPSTPTRCHVLILTAIVVGVATTSVGLALVVYPLWAYGSVEGRRNPGEGPARRGSQWEAGSERQADGDGPARSPSGPRGDNAADVGTAVRAVRPRRPAWLSSMSASWLSFAAAVYLLIRVSRRHHQLPARRLDPAVGHRIPYRSALAPYVLLIVTAIALVGVRAS